MIRLENLSKTYVVQGKRKMVADNISVVFPSGISVALLGRNGAGKSSLLRMIAGTMDASAGRVVSEGSISWPVGFAGSFHPELTGKQNTRFVARIYGVDSEALVDYVEDFADLGQHFNLPFRTYSSGMRARLAFGTSMGIRFDTYLVDEVMSVGDTGFKRKSQQVFRDRMSKSGAIVVSHSTPVIRNFCEAGAVLENGQLTWYDEIEDAIAHHDRNMKAGI